MATYAFPREQAQKMCAGTCTQCGEPMYLVPRLGKHIGKNFGAYVSAYLHFYQGRTECSNEPQLVIRLAK